MTDNVHSYTWDAEGKAITADGLALTYDALGRMVEQGGVTQIVYSPVGQKFALMAGQTVSKAFVPLPGGAQAVYAGTALAYFRHPDWLGSSRLTTTTSQTVSSSLSYAPFGETYAEAGTPDRSFTGQNQDTIAGSTAGLYDFLFRQHAQYGRWTSPDPAGMSAVSLGTPQSWNRYSYASNNPVSWIDPLGLSWCAEGYCISDVDGGGMNAALATANLSLADFGFEYIDTPYHATGTLATPPVSPEPETGDLTNDPEISAAWGAGSAFSGQSGWAPDRSGPAGPPAPTNNQPQPPPTSQQCVQNAKAPDPLTEASSTVAFINNPVTHLLDDVALMGLGAAGISGTVAFNLYAFGETAGAATPLLVMADPALLYGSWHMMKTGYNKFKGDINEFRNVVHDLRKPGC